MRGKATDSAGAEGSKPGSVSLTIAPPYPGPQHAPSKLREVGLDEGDLIAIRVLTRGAVKMTSDIPAGQPEVTEVAKGLKGERDTGTASTNYL